MSWTNTALGIWSYYY